MCCEGCLLCACVSRSLRYFRLGDFCVKNNSCFKFSHILLKYFNGENFPIYSKPLFFSCVLVCDIHVGTTCVYIISAQVSMTFDPFYVIAGCSLWHLPVIFVPCCHANRSGPLSVPAQVPVAWLMMENWVGPGNKASVFQHSHHKLFTDCFCLALLLFLQYIS